MQRDVRIGRIALLRRGIEGAREGARARSSDGMRAAGPATGAPEPVPCRRSLSASDSPSRRPTLQRVPPRQAHRRTRRAGRAAIRTHAASVQAWDAAGRRPPAHTHVRTRLSPPTRSPAPGRPRRRTASQERTPVHRAPPRGVPDRRGSTRARRTPGFHLAASARAPPRRPRRSGATRSAAHRRVRSAQRVPLRLRALPRHAHAPVRRRPCSAAARGSMALCARTAPGGTTRA